MRKLFLLLTLAVFVGVVSCKKVDRPDFRFINRNDVINLDLNQMSYAQDIRVTWAIREGLYADDPATNKPVPALAAETKTSADGKEWTFKIRPDAKWGNGDPLTANDFVFSWKLMLQAPGEYAYLLYYIKNAEAWQHAYADGKPLPELGVRAVDDHTLVVDLHDPVTFFPSMMAFAPFLPRHEKSMEPFKVTDAKGRVSYNPEYTKPAVTPGGPGVVTNGPFNLVKWDFGQALHFKKNPYYWDAAHVKCDTIEMAVVLDPQQQFNMYESGAVDWITDPAPQQAVDLKAAGRKDLKTGVGFGTQFLTVNVAEKVPGYEGKNPLSDLRVRKALDMAIDKKAIVDEITRMGEMPATTYTPPGIFDGFEVKPGYVHDVEAAKKLLAEAGYPGGKGFPSIPLIFNTDSPIRPNIAQVLKNQWESTLGIPVEIKGIELKGYHAATQGKQYVIALAAWFGDYADPSTFTDKYLSTAENNNSNWNNPAYDKLLASAASELDPAKRLAMLSEAEAMVDAELPVMPLFHAVNFMLVKDNVEGIAPNPRSLVNFKVVYVKK
jgi:oligopeptide transport system substrate-binding protein